VILVDDTAGLLDPIRLELTPEAETVLSASRLAVVLNPTVTDSWGWRERTLDEAGFMVVPCDAAGIVEVARIISDSQRADVASLNPLTYAAERGSERQSTGGYPALLRAGIDRFLSQVQPVPSVVTELLEQLARYLGRAGFTWFGALAAYPSVQPDLTRELGARLTRALGQPIFSAQTYMAIARLPWVTQGRMPDWLRRALLRSLPVEAARATRQGLQALLSQPRVRGAVSLDVSLPQTLWQRLRSPSGPRPKSPRDVVLLRFMASGSRPLLVPAPQWLERIFRPQTARWVVLIVAGIFAAFFSIASWWVSESDVSAFVFVGAMAATLAIALWHIIRVHVRNDVISRSGIVLSSLLLLLPFLSTVFGFGEEFRAGSYALALLLIVTFSVRVCMRAQFLEDRLDIVAEALVQSLSKLWIPLLAYFLVPLGLITIDSFHGWATVLKLVGLASISTSKNDLPFFGGLILTVPAFGLFAVAAGRARISVSRVLCGLLLSVMLASVLAALIAIAIVVWWVPKGLLEAEVVVPIVLGPLIALGVTTSTWFLARRMEKTLPFAWLFAGMCIYFSIAVYVIIGPPSHLTFLLSYLLSPLASLPYLIAVSNTTGFRNRVAVLIAFSVVAAISFLPWPFMTFGTSAATMTYTLLSGLFVIIFLKVGHHSEVRR
jgi:hypothetical protein